MRGLVMILGESFRMGTQNTRTRGTPESYAEQIRACESHIAFLRYISNKYRMDHPPCVFVASYTTPFDAKLLYVYRKYISGHRLYKDVVGINTLLQESLAFILKNEKLTTMADLKTKYDFILFLRIDLFLKDYFIKNFDPRADLILYPSICFLPYDKVGKHPRVNDTMMFVPAKYFEYFPSIEISHESWYYLVSRTDLTHEDLGTMVKTYHDSDSFKDWNPLYYIVNREQNQIFHSRGHEFDKYKYV